MIQLKSTDGVLTITVSSDPTCGGSLPQADFSIIEVPSQEEKAKELYEALFKTQRTNHISLATVRLPRKLRLKVFSNLTKAEEAGFKYHDHITIVSQDEYKSIPMNLSHTGETCVLFTKGEELNKSATSWFNKEKGDCTNVWDVTPQPNESQVSRTTSRSFSWEQGVLMSQLSSPMICRKFLVVGVPEVNMAEFANKFALQMHVVTEDELSARRVLKMYQKFLEKQNNRR